MEICKRCKKLQQKYAENMSSFAELIFLFPFILLPRFDCKVNLERLPAKPNVKKKNEADRKEPSVLRVKPMMSSSQEENDLRNVLNRNRENNLLIDSPMSSENITKDVSHLPSPSIEEEELYDGNIEETMSLAPDEEFRDEEFPDLETAEVKKDATAR